MAPTAGQEQAYMGLGPGDELQGAVAVTAPRRRPGRPRKGEGKDPFMWRGEQVEALLQMRYSTMWEQFERARTAREVREVWEMLATRLKEQIGVTADSAQCKTKLRNLRRQWLDYNFSSNSDAGSTQRHHKPQAYELLQVLWGKKGGEGMLSPATSSAALAPTDVKDQTRGTQSASTSIATPEVPAGTSGSGNCTAAPASTSRPSQSAPTLLPRPANPPETRPGSMAENGGQYQQQHKRQKRTGGRYEEGVQTQTESLERTMPMTSTGQFASTAGGWPMSMGGGEAMQAKMAHLSQVLQQQAEQQQQLIQQMQQQQMIQQQQIIQQHQAIQQLLQQQKQQALATQQVAQDLANVVARMPGNQ